MQDARRVLYQARVFLLLFCGLHLLCGDQGVPLEILDGPQGISRVTDISSSVP